MREHAPSRGRRRLTSVALATAGHLLALALVLWLQPAPPQLVETPPITVTLVPPAPPPPPPPPPPPEPKPDPGDAPAAAAPEPKPTPPKPPPKRAMRPTPKPPPQVKPLQVAVAETSRPDPATQVSDAELAGASRAGSGAGAGGSGSGEGAGSGGRQCDMVGLLQRALRKDGDVQAALARAHSAGGAKAIRIWNGDWLRDSSQEGKGLAGVRQAIALEVAFAPKACRTEPVRGLVMISMNDGPGAARIVLGSGQWRWSDLLFAR